MNSLSSLKNLLIVVLSLTTLAFSGGNTTAWLTDSTGHAPTHASSAATSNLKKVFEYNDRAFDKFETHLKNNVVREGEQAIRREMSYYRNRVSVFADWNYSYSTKGTQMLNSTLDTGASAINWASSWVRETNLDNRRNDRLIADKFEELVISDYKLKESLKVWSDCTWQQLQQQTAHFISRHSQDLSAILQQEIQVKLPAEYIEAEFKKLLQKVQSQKIEGITLGGYYLSSFASLTLGEYAGAFAASQISTWLTVNWYAGLTSSGQLLAWMGLSAPPAGIAAASGLVGGVVTFGAAVAVGFAIDWVMEKFTRPGFEAKLRSAISGLEEGLIYGNGRQTGLNQQCEMAISELCESLRRLHEKLIRSIATQKGIS